MFTQFLLGVVLRPAIAVAQRGLAPADQPFVRENAAAAGEIAVVVGRAPGTEQRLEMRWIELSGEQLDLREIRYTKHDNVAVAPGLCGYPFGRLVDILEFLRAEELPFALGFSGPAHIADHVDVATACEKGRIAAFE